MNLGLWEEDEQKYFNCNSVAKWIRDNTSSVPQDILDAFFYINSLIKGRMHDRIFGELSKIGEAELGDEGVLAAKIWCVNKPLATRIYILQAEIYERKLVRIASRKNNKS